MKHGIRGGQRKVEGLVPLLGESRSNAGLDAAFIDAPKFQLHLLAL